MSTPDANNISPLMKNKKDNININKTTNKDKSSNSKDKDTPTPQANDIIVNNYVLLTQIGKGAFGEIYLSYNLRDNVEVAVKKEVRKLNKYPQLKTESKIYQSLLNIQSDQDLSGSIPLSQDEVLGVPKFYGMGEYPDGYYLVMEFLGPNLADLFKFTKARKFTISCVCLIAMQMINRIEYLHKKGYLHRDIKPENFMVGSQLHGNVIYLIDFGLSKRFKNSKNNQHIPYKEGRNLIGTARYVSINTHLGIEQSRRDDLESIGYLIIFFLKGSLPWQGLKGDQKYQKIMEKKLQIPTDILCLNLPEEINLYLNYVKSLRFEDRPDYDFIKGLFIRCLKNTCNLYGIDKDYLQFDWTFEDPKKTIWKFYKNSNSKKNNRDDEQETLINSSKNNDDHKNVKDIKNEDASKEKNNDDSDMKKNIFEKTNENNPDVSLNNEENSDNNSNNKDCNDIENSKNKYHKDNEAVNSITNENNIKDSEKDNSNAITPKYCNNVNDKQIEIHEINKFNTEESNKKSSPKNLLTLSFKNNNTNSNRSKKNNLDNKPPTDDTEKIVITESFNEKINEKIEEKKRSRSNKNNNEIKEESENSEDTIDEQFSSSKLTFELTKKLYETMNIVKNGLDNKIDEYINQLYNSSTKINVDNNKNECNCESINNSNKKKDNKLESYKDDEKMNQCQNTTMGEKEQQRLTSCANEINNSSYNKKISNKSKNNHNNNKNYANNNLNEIKEKQSNEKSKENTNEKSIDINNQNSKNQYSIKKDKNIDNNSIKIDKAKDAINYNNISIVKIDSKQKLNLDNNKPIALESPIKNKEVYIESTVFKDESYIEAPIIVVSQDYNENENKKDESLLGTKNEIENSKINEIEISKTNDLDITKINNINSGIINTESNILETESKDKTKESIKSSLKSKKRENEEKEKARSKFDTSNNNNNNNNSNLSNNLMATKNSKQVKDIKLRKEVIIKVKKEPLSKYYVVQTDIGQGSFGKVKRVRHKKLGEDRAMKIILKQSKGAQNEIDILRSISHPNIMNIYEIFEDSKKYYIITEYLDGGELFEFITNQGSFSESDAAMLMKQVLQGVNYLHSNGIVHRDLKPENIMLVSKPNSLKKYSLKIIDFGTAAYIQPGEMITKFIGTSYYIAPEVLAENYNEKCDVWSCGVILYILLCGYPPFNGSSNIDIFHNIQYSQPLFNTEEWNEVSPSAIDLIKRMLNKNPKSRLSAEDCLKHKWFKDNEINDPFGLKGVKQSNQLKAVDKMTEFVHENKFKQAVLQFITTQFDIKQEEEQLRDIFKQFDVEGTGQITKKAFYKELAKLYGEEEAKIKTNKIFSTLDLDGNGDISYNEFLTSIIDSKKFITNERLDKAFKLFDKDGNGKLSIDEIRAVFGGDEKQWREIIHEVDLNDDGEVDFEEFKELMTGDKTRNLIEQTINTRDHIN